MKKFAIAAAIAFAFVTPSFAEMMDYDKMKMKIEESLKMHPLEAEKDKMAHEAVMKADEMYKAGKQEEAAKALEETAKMYKIDLQ